MSTHEKPHISIPVDDPDAPDLSSWGPGMSSSRKSVLSLPAKPRDSLPPPPSTWLKSVPAPSFGFWLVLTSAALAAAFFAWAARTPLLDQAFTLLSAREHDEFRGYAEADVATLSRTLDEYPGFVRALTGRRGTTRFLEPTGGTDGWLSLSRAHLGIRKLPQKPLVLSVEARGVESDFPLEVTISGPVARRSIVFEKPMVKTVELAADEPRRPSIATIDSRAARNPAPGVAPTWAIRVTSESLPVTE